MINSIRYHGAERRAVTLRSDEPARGTRSVMLEGEDEYCWIATDYPEHAGWNPYVHYLKLHWSIVGEKVESEESANEL